MGTRSETCRFTQLKHAAPISIIVGLLILIWAPGLFSASLNFEASEQYLVKDKDPVVFSFNYDPSPEDNVNQLTIELDYNNDGKIDFTRNYENLGQAAVQPSYEVTYETPGYFDVEARFLITSLDENSEARTTEETLGPIRINVANWKFSGVGCIESTPLVSSDGKTVYVGSEDGNLYALNTATGTEKWRFNTNGQVDSTPALDSEGNIYFGSEDGHVYCLEPEAGALVWQFPPAGRSGVGHFFGSPALDEHYGNLYIGSTDNHLYALKMDNGSLEWSFKAGSKIVSSPVIGADRTIYCGSLDENLYALHPNGTQKWRFKAAYKIRAAPAIDKDGTIFVGTCGLRGEVNENNGLHAVSPAGMELWFVKKINGFPAAPVIGESGTVIIGSYDNRFYAIDRNGSSLNMYKTFEDDVLSSAAIASNSYLFTGAKDGIFYALNPEKGNQRNGREEYWKYDLSMPITASSPVIKNNFVYVGTCSYEKGALFSFLCTDGGNTDLGPEGNAPWPQERNKSANTGRTDLTPETIDPSIALTDPAPGETNFDTARNSISVTFTMPMEPTSIRSSNYFGFTLEPFEAPEEDFTMSSNSDNTKFTLTLPEGASFEADTEYTATILSRAHAEGDSNRSILYTYSWNFSQEEKESHDNSHDAWSCFIGTLFD